MTKTVIHENVKAYTILPWGGKIVEIKIKGLL